MHLQPSGRQLTHERLAQWEKEWLRALVVRKVSPKFNYEDGEPGVMLAEMAEGDVKVILSPFDEMDFTRRYGSNVIGEITAFSHPKQLASYLGLVPSEHSSGTKITVGADGSVTISSQNKPIKLSNGQVTLALDGSAVAVS